MRYLSVEERQEDLGWKGETLVVLGSLLAGFAGVSILFLVNGVNPLYAIFRVLQGGFGSVWALTQSVVKALPLLIIALGLVFPFKGKFWNIGADSQMLMGALACTALALGPLSGLSAWAAIPLLILAGAIAGALWGLGPAILKIKLGVNEVISTLMLNYIATEFILFLVIGPMRGASRGGYPYTDDLPAAFALSPLPGTRIVLVSLILALAFAFILQLIASRSKLGYEIRVVGENREAARYAGINFLKVTAISMAISGGMAGLAGSLEILGVHHHLSQPEQITAGYGFTAIIVAWLARLSPIAAIPSAFFFAGILVGGLSIQTYLHLPAATVSVFNGILLVFFIAGEFFRRNRPVLKRRAP